MQSAQLDFFSATRRATFRDESFPYGATVPVTEAGREAMRQVISNAGESFRQRATDFILETLRTAGHDGLSGEDLTNKCKDAGILPHDDRAFGPVLADLSRKGLIEKAGVCPRAKGHGTAGGNIWVRAGRPE